MPNNRLLLYWILRAFRKSNIKLYFPTKIHKSHFSMENWRLTALRIKTFHTWLKQMNNKNRFLYTESVTTISISIVDVLVYIYITKNTQLWDKKSKKILIETYKLCYVFDRIIYFLIQDSYSALNYEEYILCISSRY